MSPPAPWGDMDSPVKPANDAKGGVTVHTPSSLQRKLESRADYPLDSSFRWNDGEGTTALCLPSWERGGGRRLKGGSGGGVCDTIHSLSTGNSRVFPQDIAV